MNIARLHAVPARAALSEPTRADPLTASSLEPVQASALRPTPGLASACVNGGEQRAAIDADMVVAWLEEAGQTLLSLPRSGPTTGLRQTRHQFVAEALEAYGASEYGRARPPVPSALRITRMDQALAWIPLISSDRLILRRIVGCRALVSPMLGRHLYSWRRLARLVGADHKAVQRWHATGIGLIVDSLNQNAALMQSWNALR